MTLHLPLSPSQKTAFRKNLYRWYRKNHRPLPWRSDPPNPYHIALSEFMLQQTQIKTALPYYKAWLKKFPSWEDLTKASPQAVLKAWEGLGYYHRAKSLHRLAKWVTQEGKGKLPSDVSALQALPGIGRYTAGAIASFALGIKTPLVDGNVERVFSRVFEITEEIKSPLAIKKLWVYAQELLPQKIFSLHNQALMELGALVCSPTRPKCLECPLKNLCQANLKSIQDKLPLKRTKKITTKKEHLALIVQRGRIFTLLPHGKSLLGDMWQLPPFDKKLMTPLRLLSKFTYHITRYRIELKASQSSFIENPSSKKTSNPQGKWLTPSQLEKASLPSAHRKVLRAFFTA